MHTCAHTRTHARTHSRTHARTHTHSHISYLMKCFRAVVAYGSTTPIGILVGMALYQFLTGTYMRLEILPNVAKASGNQKKSHVYSRAST